MAAFRGLGPPGFFQIRTREGQDPGPLGAMQLRRELVPGVPTIGFECTIGVTDVDAVAATVLAQGETLLIPKTVIPTVGSLIFFRDPEGNIVGAMQYPETSGAEEE